MPIPSIDQILQDLQNIFIEFDTLETKVSHQKKLLDRKTIEAFEKLTIQFNQLIQGVSVEAYQTKLMDLHSDFTDTCDKIAGKKVDPHEKVSRYIQTKLECFGKPQENTTIPKAERATVSKEFFEEGNGTIRRPVAAFEGDNKTACIEIKKFNADSFVQKSIDGKQGKLAKWFFGSLLGSFTKFENKTHSLWGKVFGFFGFRPDINVGSEALSYLIEGVSKRPTTLQQIAKHIYVIEQEYNKYYKAQRLAQKIKIVPNHLYHLVKIIFFSPPMAIFVVKSFFNSINRIVNLPKTHDIGRAHLRSIRTTLLEYATLIEKLNRNNSRIDRKQLQSLIEKIQQKQINIIALVRDHIVRYAPNTLTRNTLLRAFKNRMSKLFNAHSLQNPKKIISLLDSIKLHNKAVNKKAKISLANAIKNWVLSLRFEVDILVNDSKYIGKQLKYIGDMLVNFLGLPGTIKLLAKLSKGLSVGGYKIILTLVRHGKRGVFLSYKLFKGELKQQLIAERNVKIDSKHPLRRAQIIKKNKFLKAVFGINNHATPKTTQTYHSITATMQPKTPVELLQYSIQGMLDDAHVMVQNGMDKAVQLQQEAQQRAKSLAHWLKTGTISSVKGLAKLGSVSVLSMVSWAEAICITKDFANGTLNPKRLRNFVLWYMVTNPAHYETMASLTTGATAKAFGTSGFILRKIFTGTTAVLFLLDSWGRYYAELGGAIKNLDEIYKEFYGKYYANTISPMVNLASELITVGGMAISVPQTVIYETAQALISLVYNNKRDPEAYFKETFNLELTQNNYGFELATNITQEDYKRKNEELYAHQMSLKAFQELPAQVRAYTADYYPKIVKKIADCEAEVNQLSEILNQQTKTQMNSRELHLLQLLSMVNYINDFEKSLALQKQILIDARHQPHEVYLAEQLKYNHMAQELKAIKSGAGAVNWYQMRNDIIHYISKQFGITPETPSVVFSGHNKDNAHILTKTQDSFNQPQFILETIKVKDEMNYLKQVSQSKNDLYNNTIIMNHYNKDSVLDITLQDTYRHLMYHTDGTTTIENKGLPATTSKTHINQGMSLTAFCDNLSFKTGVVINDIEQALRHDLFFAAPTLEGGAIQVFLAKEKETPYQLVMMFETTKEDRLAETALATNKALSFAQKMDYLESCSTKLQLSEESLACVFHETSYVLLKENNDKVVLGKMKTKDLALYMQRSDKSLLASSF